MPSTSAKQAKFMRAVANSPKFAKKVGVSQSVGKDFEMADKKMKKFGDGGSPRRTAPQRPQRPQMPREPITGGPDTVPMTPERREFLRELERRNREAAADAVKTAKKATPYAKGGKTMKKMGKMADKAGRALVKKSADTMGRAMKMNKGGKCYAEGGSVSSASKRADGCAVKGKTKGKMLAMGGMAGYKRGGKAC